MVDVLERTAKELKALESRRQAVKGIRVRIRMLETDVVGIGGFDHERPRVNESKGRSGRYGNMEERDELQRRERALQGWIEHMESSLAGMHPEDQRILREFYCTGKPAGEAVRVLEEALNMSRSDIYRKREGALSELAARLGYIL